MSLPFQHPDIHCSKCDYEGESKKVVSAWPPVLFISFLIGTWAVPLLWLGAVAFLFYFLFFGTKDVCPECKCESPTLLGKWRETHPPVPPDNNQ
jgi:hypothetical protein